MKTRTETMREILTAWTQGGSPEIYRSRADCLQWLQGMREAGEDIDDGYFALRDLTPEQLAELAAELCGMYEAEEAEKAQAAGYLYTVTIDHYEHGRGHTYSETIESETAPEIFAPDFQEIRAESITDGPDAWTDITVTFYPLDPDGEPDTAHPAAVYRDGQTITGQH